MNRIEVLNSAMKCVCGDREEDYGNPESNFTLISTLWTAYTGVNFSPVDVAMMMALLKIARIKVGTKSDSFVDLAGYAACAGEIAADAQTISPVNACVSCGTEIPEGRQVCPACLREASR